MSTLQGRPSFQIDVPEASALRGLCALWLLQVTALADTQLHEEADLAEYVPRIDRDRAELALLRTRREDYEAAAEWLIETMGALEP